MDQQLAQLFGQLDRLQQFFPRVEGRATFLFAVVLAQLGVLAVNFPIEAPASFAAFLAAISTCGLGATLWRIYGVLFPHLDPAPRPSLVYFGDIAKLDELEYCRRIKSAHGAELVDDVASQIWRNSEILDLKFSRMKQAFQIAAFSLVPWLIFLASVTVATGAAPKMGAG